MDLKEGSKVERKKVELKWRERDDERDGLCVGRLERDSELSKMGGVLHLVSLKLKMKRMIVV